MANVPGRQIFGTAQTVINTGTDIAASNFSGAPSATFDNTTDSAVPYARFALAMAEFPDWAAAPVAGTVIELWGVLIDTDGTDDDTDAPSGTAAGGARFFGAWVIAAADALEQDVDQSVLLALQPVGVPRHVRYDADIEYRLLAAGEIERVFQAGPQMAAELGAALVQRPDLGAADRGDLPMRVGALELQEDRQQFGIGRHS